jgi:cephalosporin-C deacetylase-like acetyl esterase
MNITPKTVLFYLILFSGAGASQAFQSDHQYSRIPFTLGPVSSGMDLRNMVRGQIVRQSCTLIEQGAIKRIEAFQQGEWQSWRQGVRRAVLSQMGEMPFGESGSDLNIRRVSSFEWNHCRVENVLFESLPGWDVNASLFLPDEEKFPPPWQAIVVPVGHSSKTRPHYQIPAQAFAHFGYVAVIFDPPGMAGEKQGGNDHFTDAVRCYLTGYSANRYFVIDALRVIDYLETRDDIDMSNGVGMTGVSGGGTTTMHATLLDDRIKAAGPSCCAVPIAYHPVLDGYSTCSETLPPGRFKYGLDNVDLLCAALPTPLLLMCGEKDEVFKIEWSRQIAADIDSAYNISGHDDRFQFYADPGGHDYTLEMARRFTKWMDKWVGKRPQRAIPSLLQTDFELIPAEKLFCYPNLEGNIFSLNRELALRLKKKRKAETLSESIRHLAHLPQPCSIPSARCSEPFQVWVHNVEEIMLNPEPNIELPATFMYPMTADTAVGAVLFFDDRGRWSELRSQGLLAELAIFLDRSVTGSAVMSVDLRGWGDTTPAFVPYEIASWGDRDRYISYLSAAMGDHIFAQQIRDGAAALAYLKARKEIDAKRIVVGGHGLGAVVALHVSGLDKDVAGILAMNTLWSFESLAISETYSWSLGAFFPNVLRYYDLPDLVRQSQKPLLMVNPLNADKLPINPGSTRVNNPKVKILHQPDQNQEILRFIHHLIR